MKKDIYKKGILIMEKKQKNSNSPTHCVICGCMPRPGEWSIVAENCCYDCA